MARKISKILSIALLLGMLAASKGTQRTAAQTQPNRWSPIEQLSSVDANSSAGYIVSDPYGNVDVFWSESGGDDDRPRIEYSRFDGQSWSAPNDIVVLWPDSSAGYLAAAADSKGSLHLLINETSTKSLFYVHAPANQAGSAKAWSRPFPLDILAFSADIVVDSKDVIHILYADYYGEVPGIYYIRSTDGGYTWSSPFWLDPNIPFNNAPGIVQLALDDHDGLHALWYYVDLGESSNPATMIEYSHSFDSGKTWSTPFVLDKADESPEELRAPYPGMLVSGGNVYAIWAGDEQVHRDFRYSTDYGETWSDTTRIFGDLVGQSLGGGLATDSTGRLHYITQLRYPQGLYHGVFDGNVWSIPELIYLTAVDSSDPGLGRIHAHNSRLVMRNGNQLVLIFTNNPQEDQLHLYTMHSTLENVNPLPALPTPTLAPSLTVMPDQAQVSVQATPTPNPTLVALAEDSGPANGDFSPARGLFLGIIPPVLLIVGIAFLRLFRKR